MKWTHFAAVITVFALFACQAGPSAAQPAEIKEMKGSDHPEWYLKEKEIEKADLVTVQKRLQELEARLKDRFTGIDKRLDTQQARTDGVVQRVNANSQRIKEVGKGAAAGAGDIPRTRRVGVPKADQPGVTEADINALWAQIHEILNTLDALTGHAE